jgi:preprotein translocase subunit SecF
MRNWNIYEYKHYKMFVIIPIALLLISLYFIPSIHYDTSLRGGATVTIVPNGTVNIRALTAYVDSNIPGAEASVSKSPGGLSIEIVANSSISAGETDLITLLGYQSNYSTASVDAAAFSTELSSDPSNSTAKAGLAAADANISSSIASMSALMPKITSELAPFITKGNFTYNASSPSSMVAAASSELSAAQSSYQNLVLGKIRSFVPFSSYSYDSVTPTLGKFFLGDMVSIIITAFVLVAIAVLIVFRSFVPALAVVFGAANDIIVALGAMSIFNIPLGVASVGGLLMLIGYAIDTDMLSSVRILKRGEGTPVTRAFSTMKTGLTMTSSAIIVFGLLFIISYLSFIPTYYEIAGVVLAGLVADIFTTWFGNTVMVLTYKLRKG